MSPRTRCADIALSVIFVLGLGLTEGLSAEDELRQVSCRLDYGFPSIGLRKASEIDTAGAHTFLVDFQEDGPVIRLPPEYYSPDWEQIEEITFQSIGPANTEGRLSLKISDGSSSAYVQPIGIIRRACWDAAKRYLKNEKIKRPIKEIAENSN